MIHRGVEWQRRPDGRRELAAEEVGGREEGVKWRGGRVKWVEWRGGRVKWVEWRGGRVERGSRIRGQDDSPTLKHRAG